MTDQTATQIPLWQRVLNNQRFQMFLWNAVKVSGLSALPLVQKWFPGATVDSISGEIIMAIPFVVGMVVDWYRSHPDNILARARKVIVGGTASPAAVAKVADAAVKAA